MVCHRAINYPVIVAHGEINHGPGSQRVIIENYGPFLDRSNGQNGNIRLVNDRKAHKSAEDAGIGDRKSRFVYLVRLQFLSAGAFGQIGYGALKLREAFLVGILQHRNNQAGVEPTATPILISLCMMMLVPSMDALTIGKARRASAQARTKK